jgi:hypothetical protein
MQYAAGRRYPRRGTVRFQDTQPEAGPCTASVRR